MKPLELTLEGFMSYREPTTFSLEDRSLFGIVGPTGAGKSSILDGLIYALYGRTPRIGKDTKKLINAREDQARVQLVFQGGGRTWEVTRVLRNKGPSVHVIHERDDASEPISGEGPVSAKVAELVGLDFDAFCSSVTLPQGQFSQFLRATPTERSKILKGVFRLERVDLLQSAAKTRRGVVEAEIARLSEFLAGFPEDIVGAEAELVSRVDTSKALVAQISAALPAVVAAEKTIAVIESRLQALESQRSQAEAAQSVLPMADEVVEVAKAAGEAASTLTSASEVLRRIVESHEAAERSYTDLVESFGGPQWFTDVGRAITERERLVSEFAPLQAGLAGAESSRVETGSKVAAAEAQMKADLATITTAKATLIGLQQAHRAHLLRADLKAGEPCPVCEVPVTTIPATGSIGALDVAESEVSRAETAYERSRKLLEDSRADLKLVDQRAADMKQRLDELQVKLDVVVGQLSGLVGDIEPEQELSRREGIIAGLALKVEEMKAARNEAMTNEVHARDAFAGAEKRRLDLVTGLNNARGRLGMPVLEVDSAHQVLVEASEATRAAAETAITAANEQLLALGGETAASNELIVDFRALFDARPGEPVHAVLVRAEAAASDDQRGLEQFRSALGERKRSLEQLDLLRAKADILQRLIADLTDARFTAYLLQARRRLLSELGSDKLMELTGRYRFDPDGNFNILDEGSGTTRGPDTLSGGETFLASLALALALSDAAAREGGVLDCFFLDEGFGSLDAESLNLALEGIERLATPGRLIGLISHVRDMQAEMEDLIVLDKAPDGSTIVIQHEGPFGYAPLI